jgi:RNA polymerase sigma-70 factor (ECF subfamily)
VDQDSYRPDDALLRDALRDGEAFAEFYRRHEGPLLLYFMRRTGDPELAADLTAEVFAEAISSLRRFRSDRGSAVSWLYGIAAHALSASHRKRRVVAKARRRLSMDRIELTDADLERIEALADTAEVAASLHEALAALPPEQRAALQARVVEERSYGEIASELQCSQAVVRKRVSRGLNALRITLSEEAQ